MNANPTELTTAEAVLSFAFPKKIQPKDKMNKSVKSLSTAQIDIKHAAARPIPSGLRPSHQKVHPSEKTPFDLERIQAAKERRLRRMKSSS